MIYKNLSVNVYLFCYLDFHGHIYPKDVLHEFLSQGMNVMVAFKGRLPTDPSDSISLLSSLLSCSHRFLLEIHGLQGGCRVPPLLHLAHSMGDSTRNALVSKSKTYTFMGNCRRKWWRSSRHIKFTVMWASQALRANLSFCQMGIGKGVLLGSFYQQSQR